MSRAYWCLDDQEQAGKDHLSCMLDGEEKACKIFETDQ